MKRALQPRSATTQQPQRHEHVPALPADLLTEAQACERVKVFDTCKYPVRQFQKWARKRGVPVAAHVGRRKLYDPRILAAFLQKREWTRRHAAAGEAAPSRRLHVVAHREGR